MTTPDALLILRDSFVRLEQECGGRLRADYQQGGWGRSARELLRRGPLPSGSIPTELAEAGLTPLTATEFERLRPMLENQATAPPWVLRHAPGLEHKFKGFACQAAVRAGARENDTAWIAWLDLIRERLNETDDDGVPCDGISNVCRESIRLCELLATGVRGIAVAVEGTATDTRVLSPERRADLEARAQTLTDTERKQLSDDRRARVDAYLAEQQLRTGSRWTRKLIWARKCKYKTAKDFEQWQRVDPRTTKTARDTFERVLQPSE